MKLLRLKGVVDRVTEGVAVVVPEDRSRERYVPSGQIPEVREGLPVDLLVIPGAGENDLCQVVSEKPARKVKPMKLASFSTLLRAMQKTREKLEATVREIESREESDGDQIEELQKKLDFLDRGIELFS